MQTYNLKLPAEEVVQLLHAELKCARGNSELSMATKKEYVIDEDFDLSAQDLYDRGELELLTSEATLSVEPRVESGSWMLQIIVEREIGPIRASEERQMAFANLTLDEFEDELRRAGRKRVVVRLLVPKPEMRMEFRRWLAEMRSRHPWNGANAPRDGVAAPRERAAHVMSTSASEETGDGAATQTYWTKEAVGVFANPDALEAAVDELEVSGFDRAAISVLATDSRARDQLDRFYRSISEVEDSGVVARGNFVDSESFAEGEAALVGVPLYIGGFAGGAAVAAAGGSLAFEIAATISGGVIGAALGALLAGLIARRHWANAREQMKRGGVVLWVAVNGREQEKRAIAALTKVGARDVHIHEIEREWSIKEIPFAESQPDPFLENQFRVRRA